ncbi:BTAD domain-containing putative transcriptional regulator [Dactylosporangium sp. AC04546]|uniref:BTAD domain-containing putative transcriptional regulator n=1 Tax=Dactylosporangium sp. AC04546 TaxID=2862460 RepID=UPI001EE10B6E|nr:BTAD domain-containing putative transcriptional regulator [Dactylosporangium sp. AC04546]WVK84299.1 BTAD domain-containing putative transcriptional regulator [Dactylosporangium sp. AC04546]
MQFGVLGPLAVTTDAGEPVVVPGTKVRMLLADLLVHRNQVVSADRLIDDLWGDDPPANAAGALQVRVSQLRKALNDAEPGARDLIESRPPGYLLRAVIDADRFLAEAAEAALPLWRGEPYADFADEEFCRAEATRLKEQRLVALERLAEVRLECGEHDLVAADLAELVAQHPLREGLRALHLRALYAAGRPAEALDSYADLRERLAEELGLDPGPELVALHQRILRQDAGLSPPPRAAIVRNALPARLDELVGRAEALAELRALLPRQRLVTLIGPGGVGKTRLAIEAARSQDGVHLVELAPLPAGDEHLAEHILTTLAIREEGDATERLVAALRLSKTLLLDNCEHVIEPAAALVGRLLRDLPALSVLATSREPLGIAGEVLWEVPPLHLPEDDHDVDAVRRSPAARLFAARAAAQQRGFRLDARTAPAVAQLCRRLDGLPLALELAATRVRAFGVQGVIDRLESLATQQRDVPPRQRTMTAVIGWSWDLLDPGDQQVLAGLAVFADGCTPGAAERVCGTDPDALARLVDRSLVVVGGGRYRLLETVAAFCLPRLALLDEVRARHAAYYTELAEQADPRLRGPEQQEWLARLDAETGNLRAALAHGGGLRLANALTWYWFLRGRFTEARRALAADGSPAEVAAAAPWRAGFALLQGDPVVSLDEALVDASPRATWFLAHTSFDAGLLPEAPDEPWTEAAVLASRAMHAHASGDLAVLHEAATRSAALFAELGDRWGRLQANDWLGGLAEMRGDHERAAALHREGLRWAEELALWPDVGSKLSWLAWIAVQTRAYSEGVALAERAYALVVEHGAPSAVVFAELSLGFACRRSGKLDLAVKHLGGLADAGRREPRPALYLPMVLVELGFARAELGDPAAALRLHLEAFDLAVLHGWPRDAAGALEGVASAAPDPAIAARLLGAAAAARDSLDAPASPAEQDSIAEVSARLSAALGAARLASLIDEGRRLSPGEARALLTSDQAAG